jgi:hypothetical protein
VTAAAPTSVVAKTTTPPQNQPPKQPLDDIMLAMDVVDTLRRKRRLVEQELDVAGREQDLKERLRKIYAAQGIEVTDAILEEGVAALKEDRFLYKPPPDSFGVTLARLYVKRGLWGKWVLGALAALVIGLLAWQFLVVAPRNALPKDLETLHAEVVELAVEASADQQADELLASARKALRDGDTAQARALYHELTELRNQLEASYRIRIVNRPGERSGVWRVPDLNQAARNYYIIVEALGPDGRNLRVPIKNEETGKIEQVERWGLRVDEGIFNRVGADKQDDGIIQQDSFGRKRAGKLEPEYEVPTSGAAITSW